MESKTLKKACKIVELRAPAMYIGNHVYVGLKTPKKQQKTPCARGLGEWLVSGVVFLSEIFRCSGAQGSVIALCQPKMLVQVYA